MTEEQTSPTTEAEQQGGSEGDTKAARRAAIDKLSVEFQSRAVQNATAPTRSTESNEDLDIDELLDGLDPKVAKGIKRVLKDAERQREGARTIATYALEQARRAKALEIGQEFGLDKDEIAGIEKALQGANNPEAIDLSGREIIIKLRENGTFSNERASKPAATKQKKQETADGDGRTFDTGRGSGGNKVQALLEKIDAIDPADPKAEQELAKLYKEVEQAQKAYMERRR